MAFQFPASPVLGQVFTPVAGVSYKWNGTGWAPFSTSFITVSDAVATFAALAGGNTITGNQEITGDLNVIGNTLLEGLLRLNTTGDANYEFDQFLINPARIGYRIRGAALQATDLQQWARNDGLVLASINKDGQLYAQSIDPASPAIASNAEVRDFAGNRIMAPVNAGYHKGMVKAYGLLQGDGGVQTNYNITSNSIVGPGAYQITWGPTMVSNPIVIATPVFNASGAPTDSVHAQILNSGFGTNTCIIQATDANGSGVAVNLMGVVILGFWN